MVDRARVLCVQRTGWGKSAVYFLATALRREARRRPDADRLAAAGADAQPDRRRRADRDPRAHDQLDQPRRVGRGARRCWRADAVDVLLISPERLNNPQFRAEMLPLFAERVGLLVVDEAHCISDWGHDFRPDYRRIADMLERLPEGVPVLCTTATANDRVVTRRRGAAAASAAPPRCAPTAGRSGARACASRSSTSPARPTGSPGSSSTCRSCRARASSTRSPSATPTWSRSGSAATAIAAEAYSGDSATEARVEVEERLLRNDLKAVVATSALGMGYDKPDLGFVVHYQAPGSVIAYYQQVGRAGRAIERAEVVLLRGGEDRRIQDFFIEQAFPRRELVDRVLERIADGGATTQALMAEVNLGKGRVERDAEGARRRGRGRARRLDLALARGQRLGLRRRALRAHHRAAPRASRRRWRSTGRTGAA